MKIYDTKNKKVLQTNELGYATYLEVPYTEYREDGTPKCTGTEDFTAERFKTLVTRYIYVPTGEVNKGGHRTWTEARKITSQSTKDVRKLATILVPGEISIRQY